MGKTTENPPRVRCHMAILREDDGSFSAIALNLPGIGSCGDSEEEAIANASQAVTAAVESFREDGDPVPWAAPGEYSIPDGAKLVWILVNG